MTDDLYRELLRERYSRRPSWGADTDPPPMPRLPDEYPTVDQDSEMTIKRRIKALETEVRESAA